MIKSFKVNLSEEEKRKKGLRRVKETYRIYGTP
jgi:hypothetical protein